jgi:prephenate dehydrogenase
VDIYNNNAKGAFNFVLLEIEARVAANNAHLYAQMIKANSSWSPLFV